MNLIEDKWIPARRRSGKIEMIAPWEITDAFDRDPFIQLAAPRPDFNGALIQFLIGLLQTCFAPPTSQEWQRELRLPPSPGDLRIAFLTVTPSFNLDGEGPRFMQDLTLSEEVAGLGAKAQEDRVKPIGDILIEIPTGKTLRDNTDFFVKRGYIEALCPACAGTALFTMQTNAPLGGQGHLTGIRGGGPLTTLVLADSLWATCWLSVLERSEFLRGTGNPAKNTPADQFPWLTPTRTSENGRGTTPEDAHPTQIFWATPRRIRLLFSNATGVCDLCGKKDSAVVLRYLTKNLGTSYIGPWKHSLSPYFIAQDGEPRPVHPRPGGIGYRHWIGLVQSSDDGRSRCEPAAVVARYLRFGVEDLRLWAFGYDMDKKKARCWYDSCMPLTLCSPEIQENFVFYVSALIKAADIAAFETRRQVRKALFKQGSEVKGDLSFITSRFWQETEPGFFAALPGLRATLKKNEDVALILESWHRLLIRTAEAIFNDLSQTGAFEAADPKRVALAWRGLRMGLDGKKLKQTLGLPEHAQGSTRKKGGTKLNA